MNDFTDNLEYLQAEAARRAERKEQNWATLCDYFLMAASRDEDGKLINYRPREVGVETMVKDDLLVVETCGEARVGALLAEALLLWSKDIHEPGDRASLEGGLSHAEAVVLVARHDGVRPAARATGLNKDRILRALKKEAA
jgi:hypothetical protein